MSRFTSPSIYLPRRRARQVGPTPFDRNPQRYAAAALSARQDKNLVIAGRTSALAIANLDEAVKRAKAYEADGVDAERTLPSTTACGSNRGRATHPVTSALSCGLEEHP